MPQSPQERDLEIETYLNAFQTPPSSSSTQSKSPSKSKSKSIQINVPLTHLHTPTTISISRKVCCGTSRCFYCPICCQLLMKASDLPSSLRDLNLPFHLDIILCDRRTVATGLQAFLLLQQQQQHQHHQSQSQTPHPHPKEVRLVDMHQGDNLPSYPNPSPSSSSSSSSSTTTTCVLFPSSDSIPLSSVASSLKRLIVLDCKWTKSSVLTHCPAFHKFTKVHLTTPPSTSHSWRWHTAGKGRISTLEAIYCAAWEVLPYSPHGKDDLHETKKNSIAPLLHLLYLFGLQRALIRTAAVMDHRSMPFSEQGKEEQRALRRYKGTEKQRRDKEIGNRWKQTQIQIQTQQIRDNDAPPLKDDK